MNSGPPSVGAQQDPSADLFQSIGQPSEPAIPLDPMAIVAGWDWLASDSESTSAADASAAFAEESIDAVMSDRTATPSDESTDAVSPLWVNVSAVNMAALESGLHGFLGMIEKLGDRLAQVGDSIYVPSWLTLATVAALTCEIARRQLKLPTTGLALAGSGHGDTLTWSLSFGRLPTIHD